MNIISEVYFISIMGTDLLKEKDGIWHKRLTLGASCLEINEIIKYLNVNNEALWAGSSLHAC